MTLNPCPFCGGTNLDKYRFDRAFALDVPMQYVRITDKGDNFVISCECGCSLTLHYDGLYTAWEFTADPESDAECTDGDLWEIAELCWNKRCEESCH